MCWKLKINYVKKYEDKYSFIFLVQVHNGTLNQQ